MLTRPFVVLNVCFLLSVGGWLPALSLLSVMIRDRLGSSVIAAMLTFLAMQVFAAVLGLYAGGFSARWGSRQTFMVGTAGMAIFTGLILIATYDWQVIVLAALAGMLTPFHWTGINAYMLEAVAPQRRGAAAGMVAFSLVIGPGIFGPLLTLLGDGFGLWATFAGASALLSLSFLTALASFAGSKGHGRPLPHIRQIVDALLPSVAGRSRGAHFGADQIDVRRLVRGISIALGFCSSDGHR